MGVFRRYVEIGRVVLINFGPDEGKLGTIVDIVDQNKCLVDGPAHTPGTVTKRLMVPYKRLFLTDFKVEVEQNAGAMALKAAWEARDTMARWKKTAWCKKLEAQKRRESLTDFERFKLSHFKKAKTEAVEKKIAKLSASEAAAIADKVAAEVEAAKAAKAALTAPAAAAAAAPAAEEAAPAPAAASGGGGDY